MLIANFSKKYLKRAASIHYIFVYLVEGNDTEVEDYKVKQGTFLRCTPSGIPIFFSGFYFGDKRPLYFSERHNKYLPNIAELLTLERYLSEKGYNLWRLIYNMTDNIEWITNRDTKRDLKLADISKEDIDRVGAILKKYNFYYDTDLYRGDFGEEEEHYEEKRGWNYYNDNLDMDQQSEEFWSQF